MKIKNKGKVYPSPSSSSPLSFSPNGDYLSVLNLLPAAILVLASVLSLEDREVLAYLITRSIKTTTTTTTTTTKNPSSRESKRKSSKKPNNNNNNTHKPPVFDCDCFDCYTSYWYRWDSSPNRELIHQAIEAFEDHLTNGESEKSKKTTRTKRRDKSGRRVVVDTPRCASCQPVLIMPLFDAGSSTTETDHEEPSSSTFAYVSPLGSPERVNEEVVPVDEEDMLAAAVSNHKGLARKVLPDVLGFFNSRLWSLWSPNV